MESNMNCFWGSNNRRAVYIPVSGTITQMQRMAVNGNGYGGCTKMITVEDENGVITNFFINPSTYVVGYETLYEGLPVTVFYNGNLPAPMIYPPQYMAAVVAVQMEGQMVAVGYFDQNLLAADQSLQLNLDANTEVVTANNQLFLGNPGGHTRVVLYNQTTRSIPPQTTPEKIVVLCGRYIQLMQQGRRERYVSGGPGKFLVGFFPFVW